MSRYSLKMPDLGEGIAEVEIVAWRVAPGDAVAEDQILADVLTDKATVEVPSPVAGRVLALGAPVGQSLAVGAELVAFELEGRVGAPTDSAQTTRPSAPMPAPAPAPAPTPAPSMAANAPAPTPPPAAAASRPAAAPGRAIASPAVRARAWELGIELAAVPPGGPGGRVLQADLDAWLAAGGARSLPPAPAPAIAPMATARAALPPGATEVEKVVGLRRKIAQKMQDAKRRIPHYSYVEEVDVTELEALRERLNTRHAAQRGHLTLLPFLVRALVLAVREQPQVNALFDDEVGTLTRHASVHVGIATQTPSGLMVPVLRDAQAADLWANAAEVQRLAEAARSGKVVRSELSGSTITITSLGKLGGIATTPVINAPEVAIVGVNRIAWRPVVLGGAVVARQMMNLSSSFDHRVVDGAVAAAFVQQLRELLEHPGLLWAD